MRIQMPIFLNSHLSHSVVGLELLQICSYLSHVNKLNGNTRSYVFCVFLYLDILLNCYMHSVRSPYCSWIISNVKESLRSKLPQFIVVAMNQSPNAPQIYPLWLLHVSLAPLEFRWVQKYEKKNNNSEMKPATTMCFALIPHPSHSYYARRSRTLSLCSVWICLFSPRIIGLNIPHGNNECIIFSLLLSSAHVADKW